MTTQQTQLKEHLERMGRYLRLRDGLRLAIRALWVALAGVVLIELAARYWPIPDRHLWAAAPLELWLVGVGLYSLLRPMPPARIARRLDRELGLKDRLSTALELQAAGAQPFRFDALQLDDALRTARQIEPGRLAWRIPRRPLWWAGGLVAVALVLIWLPNPMDAILARREAIRAEAQAQAEAIEEARRRFEAATDPLSEERAKALRELEALAKELAANPGDLEQALADLARTEAALRELQTPQATTRQQSADQIAAQLTALARGESQASTDLDQAAQPLDELAAALPGMDEAARRETADSLETVASQAAATNPELAESLHEMAAAMRRGDGAQARQAAGQCRGSLARADQQLNLQNGLAMAQSTLAESRRQLAQTGRRTGLAQRSGGGQQANQSGNQAGSGGGTRADQLPPANRSGRAADPSQPNRPAAEGQLETIYAPGPQAHRAGDPAFVAGQETEAGEIIIREERSPQGNPNPALVPYREAYPAYAASAAETIEREQIPPAWREYVRAYFSQLSPE